MKLPADRFPHPADENSADHPIHLAAHALLPWRVRGRRVGYQLSFSHDELMAHMQTHNELVECCEEADEFLAQCRKPVGITSEKWSYWAKALRGLAKTPELLLELSGEEFRQFQLAMFEFGNALPGTQGGAL
jgi:hypothetical protein